MSEGSSTSEHVRVTIAEGIAGVTLSRPEKRNALTPQMWAAVVEGLRSAKADSSVRALVVTGEGGSFSAGADLDFVKGTDGRPSPEYSTIAFDGLNAIADFPRPTLARIEGHCIGAGVNIALACDVRFTTPDSTFAIPAARRGLVYDNRSITRLIELTGPGQASRLLYSGATISGCEAARIGLAEVSSDDLSACVDAYVTAVLAGGADAITLTRDRIRGGVHGGYHS
ncbi:enoyl-CoA hydratase/isomerase family protein [Streptomyces sp. NPDC101225]|uniref:enoyl-CoA hydratase/isomerase family protein n=1 Tax=Streptomyces sp. NPDC101225 TaxID=3366135 RepID=UPI0038108E24